MGLVFTHGDAAELIRYGKFTLLTFAVNLPASVACIPTPPYPYRGEEPALEAIYEIREEWLIMTERYNWGDTYVPNKAYYEIHQFGWPFPWGFTKMDAPVYQEGYYCGTHIKKADIENHCMPPETLIVGDMIRQIGECIVGDETLTHTGQYKQATRTYARPYTGSLIRIKPFHSPAIDVTPNHKVLAIKTKRCSINGKTVCTQSCTKTAHKKGFYLQKGRAPKVCTQPYQDYKPEWIRADELTKDDLVLLSYPTKEEDVKTIKITDFVQDTIYEEDGIVYGRGKNPNSNTIPNEIPLTNDFLRLIGFYLSEGSTNQDKYIVFSLHSDEKAYLEDITAIMQDMFKLTPTIYYLPNEKGVRIQYGCQALTRLFQTWFGDRAGEKHIPQFIMDLPNERLFEVIKGLFRGDGSTTQTPHSSGVRCELTSTSIQLAYQTRLILFKLGYINTFATQKARIGEIDGRKINGSDSYRVYLDGYPKLSDTLFGKSWQKPTKHKKAAYLKDGYLHARIQKLEEIHYDGFVYNLEVAPDHSYNTLGITVANCTHLFAAEDVHVCLWNATGSSPEDVYVEFAVWFYTYPKKYFKQVYNIIMRDWYLMAKLIHIQEQRLALHMGAKPEDILGPGELTELVAKLKSDKQERKKKIQAEYWVYGEEEGV